MQDKDLSRRSQGSEKMHMSHEKEDKGKLVVSSKWLYKIKHAVDESVEKYKERFIAKGFSQKEGIDYGEIFSLVARYTTIRSVMSLASVLGWKLH